MGQMCVVRWEFIGDPGTVLALEEHTVRLRETPDCNCTYGGAKKSCPMGCQGPVRARGRQVTQMGSVRGRLPGGGDR
jgi:hypothetical protein